LNLSYDNNCQYFILNLLHANGINDYNLNNFIRQNTELIFATNPALRKFTYNVTDMDGRFRETIGGTLKENANVVSYNTYKRFAKKFKIKLTKEGERKTIQK